MLHHLSLAAACWALAALAAAQDAVDPGTSYLFRLRAPVDPALAARLHRDFDVLHGDPAAGDVFVVVLPGEELRRFEELASGAELVTRGRPYAEIAAVLDAPDANYYTTAEIEQEIDALVAQHPAIAAKVDLTTLPGAARTHNGQPIWALKVSDSAAAEEDEPTIVVAAQHHARELNSTHMVIGAMRRVLAGYASDPVLRQVVDDYELWFVPCVNPDGVDWVWNVDNFWRKNRRPNGGSSFGVDLNRNYPTRWGGCGASTSPGSQTYRGPSAGSEPETQTMRALIASERPEIYIDFHSSGREVLFTYAPCSAWSSTIQTFLDRYVADLRGRINYGTRAPSAAGESPEDHWNTSGTLSFLIEISTSFQPAFTSTVAEEQRVWPGLHQVLTAWRPAVRGHVRSIYRNEPVEAAITYAPNQFSQGEVTRTRSRDGRYGLWLPLGTWQVTFSAPGFVAETRTVHVTGYDQPQALDVELVPAWPAATLTASGTARIGTRTDLVYSSPGDAGLTYWVALSLGTSPGIPIGHRTVPLNADDLFFASLSAAPLLTANLGLLGPTAAATAHLDLPNLPAIVGVTFHAAGLTFETGYPEAVKRWSQPLTITIQP